MIVNEEEKKNTAQPTQVGIVPPVVAQPTQAVYTQNSGITGKPEVVSAPYANAQPYQEAQTPNFTNAQQWNKPFVPQTSQGNEGSGAKAQKQPAQPTQQVQQPVVATPPNPFLVRANKRTADATNKMLADGSFASDTNINQMQQNVYNQRLKEYNDAIAADPNADVLPPTEPTQFSSNNNTVSDLQKANEWDLNHVEKNIDAYNKAKEEYDNSFDAFRRSMYDEDKIRRRSDARAKVMALGDALRHIGNLGYTVAGATPQQYRTAPGTQEREDYEQGFNNREALAYNRYANKQKQKIAEAEQARKDLQLQWDVAKKQSDIGLNTAKEKQIALNMDLQMDKYPYEKRKLIGEAVQAIAAGNEKEAKAKIAQLEAEHLPIAQKLADQLTEAKIGQAKASGQAALTNANANMIRARSGAAVDAAKVKKINSDIAKGEKGLTFSGAYNYRLKKDLTASQKAALVDKLHKRGKVGNSDWLSYTSGSMSADKIIGDAIVYGTSQETRDILSSYGFEEIEDNMLGF